MLVVFLVMMQTKFMSLKMNSVYMLFICLCIAKSNSYQINVKVIFSKLDPYSVICACDTNVKHSASFRVKTVACTAITPSLSGMFTSEGDPHDVY